MKKWNKPELLDLGVENTASGYHGTNTDGVFIDVSSLPGRNPGDHALLLES